MVNKGDERVACLVQDGWKSGLEGTRRCKGKERCVLRVIAGEVLIIHYY